MLYFQSHEDYHGIQSAYEAIVDIADYTNESTRDHEMRQIIADVQVLVFIKNVFIKNVNILFHTQ